MNTCISDSHIICLCEYRLGSVVESAKLPSVPVVVFYHVASHGKFQSFSGLAVTTCSLTPVSIYKPYAVVTAENLCRHDVISHKYFINSKFPALQNNLKALILLKTSQRLTCTVYYHHYLGK